jgi:hypothetical protein
MWVEAINMAKGQKQNDNVLQKWIIRTIMEKQITGKDITVGEAVKIAKEKYEYEKAWLKLATNQYNIKYSARK